MQTEVNGYRPDGTKKIEDYLTAVAAIDGIYCDVNTMAGVDLVVNNGGAVNPAVVTIVPQIICGDTGEMPTARTMSVPIGETWPITLRNNEGLKLGNESYRISVTFDQVDTVSAGISI